MVDKLSVVNTCLALTGNSLVNVEEDGSAEWTVASAAYDEAVSYLLAEHDWKFATAIDAADHIGDSPDERYSDEWAIPTGSLGIVWVRSGGGTVDWKIVRNRIQTNVDETSTLHVKYVVMPDETAMPPLFVKALNELVKAGIYSGLNEDPEEARAREKAAEFYLARARTRVDRQERPRRTFRSRILARRRGLLGTATDTSQSAE